MKSKILMLFILFLAYSCGPDPANFERDLNNNVTVTEESQPVNTEKESQPVNTPTHTTYSGDGTMFVNIQKNIPVNRVCTAIGYKDGVSGTLKREKVEIKFITLSSYTSLIVIHHISGEYSVSAEFTVKNDWKEDMLVDGNRLSTTVIWPNDKTEQPLILFYEGEVLLKITLKSRTFYLQESLITPITYSSEGNRGEHIVQKGENLQMIATKYNTDVATLLQLNEKLKSNPNTIQPGMGIRFEN